MRAGRWLLEAVLEHRQVFELRWDQQPRHCGVWLGPSGLARRGGLHAGLNTYETQVAAFLLRQCV